MSDISPIDPDQKFGRRVIYLAYSLRTRDVIAMVVSLFALLLTIVFVVLYCIRATPTMTNKDSPPPICFRPECLETASHYVSLMNYSANPCKDFYSYSCAFWPRLNPPRPPNVYNSVFFDLFRKNKDKLRYLVEAPVSNTADSSSERKIKHLFQTCLSDYGRNSRGGTPFFEKVITPIGGWAAVGTCDVTSWDFNAALHTAHVDLWTNVLFGVNVQMEWWDRTNMYIVLDRGGIGMYYSFYYENYAARYRDAYKTFMETVARLLVRDSQITMDKDTVNSRVATFVGDVFNFETGLANITSKAHPDENPFDDEARVTLGELNQRSNNAIDWLSLMSYLFNKVPISDNTRVILMRTDYIDMMTAYINSLGENKNRILNNYFVWRLASAYIQDLSWEYIHANRQYYVALTGRAEFLGSWRYCFYYASKTLGLALSHLFIKDHFADKNKEKIHEITDYLKTVVLKNIGEMDWMDASTQAKAADKVNKMIGLYGYPDYLIDADKVDKIYESLVIDENDYFQNVLHVNKFEQVDLNNLLLNGLERSKFRGTTYDSYIYYSNTWNEIMVPAGFLQPPIYDYKYPYYVNFGSIGSLISHNFIHAIDKIGSYYTADGKFNRWWSNSTIINYEGKMKCMENFYGNKTIGPFDLYGRKRMFPVSGKGHATEGIAEVAGIRYAYEGYKQWQKENRYEEHLPGIDLTNDQLFFVAYAQTKCFIMNEEIAYNHGLMGILPQDMETNSALSQMDEFAKAFNCPADSKMVTDQKCKTF